MALTLMVLALLPSCAGTLTDPVDGQLYHYDSDRRLWWKQGPSGWFPSPPPPTLRQPQAPYQIPEPYIPRDSPPPPAPASAPIQPSTPPPPAPRSEPMPRPAPVPKQAPVYF